MPFDKESFLRLAQQNLASVDDEEDDVPYSSLARDGAPPPVMHADADGESNQKPEEQAQAGMMPPAAEAEAAPPPSPTMSSPNPLAADPMMRKYEEDQSRLADLRQAQRGANAIASTGAALQQLSLGVNKPQPNNDLLKNSRHMAEDVLKSEQSALSTRARVMNAIEARKFREDQKNQAKSDKQEIRDDKKLDDQEKRMADALDPNKARGGNLAKSQAIINSSDRINALFEQFPDGNIPRSQTVEIATAVAALISGGSPQSQHQINELVPSTMSGNAQDIASWLTGDPFGRQQQKFMLMLKETAGREREVAQHQVRSAQTARLPQFGYLKDHDPDRYSALLDSYGIDPEEIDERGRYKPKTKPTEPKLVRMRDPKGNIRLVKSDLVDAAIEAGGEVVKE